jgi:FkbM family methyltransferase
MLKERILQLLDVFLEPRALVAFVRWPKFSVTSFKMISGLTHRGIVPATVIDVGANVGQFAVAAAKLFPNVRVHPFEPAPEAAEQLRRNVAGIGNIRVYPIALGDTEGTVELHINSHSHSSSILRLAKSHRVAFPDAREIGTVAVKLSTLDDIFGEAELVPPVLLKLDVQGYEAMALRGGKETLKRVDYAVVETSFKPLYKGEAPFTELLRLMEDLGFSFIGPVGWLADARTRTLLQIDALFERLAGNSRRAGDSF